jgi:hypothetical protein
LLLQDEKYDNAERFLTGILQERHSGYRNMFLGTGMYFVQEQQEHIPDFFEILNGWAQVPGLECRSESQLPVKIVAWENLAPLTPIPQLQPLVPRAWVLIALPTLQRRRLLARATTA